MERKTVSGLVVAAMADRRVVLRHVLKMQAFGLVWCVAGVCTNVMSRFSNGFRTDCYAVQEEDDC